MNRQKISAEKFISLYISNGNARNRKDGNRDEEYFQKANQYMRQLRKESVNQKICQQKLPKLKYQEKKG